ncbi:MAG: dihydropteroate synthase [Pirellulaceae bacterium]|nr:dihydropteroate synthase [Pirellulaceae bacterium]
MESAPDNHSTGFRTRAKIWKLCTRGLHFGKRPLLMGIVNVTPDSFSDGGKFLSHDQAVRRALRLLDEGAEILDIGGESTRPYATPVGEAEELARVEPVVAGVLRERPEAIVSIDTSKPWVAAAAIHLGAEIINDITGLSDPRMIALASSSGVGVCAMHMQGTPQTMQIEPTYHDVVAEIATYLQSRRDALIAAGIDRERICLDPGIGFGKTHQHNLTLMAHCDRLHELGCPLLVGHSRKGFIAKVLGTPTRNVSEGTHARSASEGPSVPSITAGTPPPDRTAATIGGALALARQGVQVIRVHDVRPVREALLLFEACGGIDGTELTLAQNQ